MNNRQTRRQENYTQLIKAGFNSKEATRFKDLSRERVKELCELQNSYNGLKKSFNEEAQKLESLRQKDIAELLGR